MTLTSDTHPQNSGRQRLILAALKLYAEKGVEAVSLRMINREAGMRNNSAMHYHFGSKLLLQEAMVAFIQGWFEEAREEAICAIEQRSAVGDVPVRDVLEAFMVPYMELLTQEVWGEDALRFLARMELEASDEMRTILNNSAACSFARFLSVLEKALPQLERVTIFRRLCFFVASIMQGLADAHKLANSYLGDLSSKHSELCTLYLDFCASGMSAPVTETN